MNLLKVFSIFLSAFTLSHAYKHTPRIVDGQVATRGQFPYYVYVETFDDTTVSSGCGGALISADFVLTAAHCLKQATQRVIVHLGVSQIHSVQRDMDTMTVEPDRFHIYPYHVSLAYVNDIALIHLPRSAKLNQYIQPIKLPSDCSSNTNLIGVVMGHGKTGTFDPPTNFLQFIHLQTVPSEECHQLFFRFLWLSKTITDLFDKSVLCAKPYDGKIQSTCRVDDNDSNFDVVKILLNLLMINLKIHFAG